MIIQHYSDSKHCFIMWWSWGMGFERLMSSRDGSLSFSSSWNWHKHWIRSPISPYSTECCSDVPAPAYPPEVSPSLLHLEPQPCLDRCLSPAAHHQLFTWSAPLLIRWLIWEGEETRDALKPETKRQQGREGRITSPDRESDGGRVHRCGITDLYI